MSLKLHWLAPPHTDMFRELFALFWRITMVTLISFLFIRFIYGNPSSSVQFRLRFGLIQDEQHIRAGCLLSLLLLLPYWVTPDCNWILLGSFVVGYTFVFVPICCGVYQIPLLSEIPRLFRGSIGWIVIQVRAHLETIPAVIITLFVALPQLYRNFPGIQAVVRKIVFLALLNTSHHSSSKVVAIDFIMCYTMVSYAWKILQDCQTMNDFNYLTPKKVGKICSCAIVFCYFGRKIQNISNSSQLYSSFIYLALSEPLVEEFIVRELKLKRHPIFEDLEELYVSMMLQLVQILTSTYLCACLPMRDFILLILALYTCIYIPWEQTIVQSYRPLLMELKVMERFKSVSNSEMQTYSDRTCPICLDDMDGGRLTPCNHCFHATCIRRSLKVSAKCPKCRQDLL